MHGYGLMKRANRLILWERIYAIEMNKELRTDVLISEERERDVEVMLRLTSKRRSSIPSYTISLRLQNIRDLHQTFPESH